MTDRRASFEGPFGRSRHRSPNSDDSLGYLQGDPAYDLHPASSAPRRRSLRSKAVSDEPPHFTPSIWVDTDKGNSLGHNGGRAAPRKASKGSPHSPPSPETLDAELEKDTSGFLPKLGRILEGKEGKTLRRRKDSAISSRGDHTLARRSRPSEDATLSRRPVRQKHGSLVRRVESLSNLPNPSLISVLSDLTQQSGVSNGSNSTITQQSYDKSHIVKRKPVKERKRLHVSKSPSITNHGNMAPSQSNVFRYMNESLASEQFLNGQPHDSRPSTASTASSNTSRDSEDDGHSSHAGEPAVESPSTSPASIRRVQTTELHHDNDEDDSDSDDSAEQSNPGSTHQPSVSDDVDEQDGQLEVEEEEPEEDHSDEDEDERSSAADSEPMHHHHAHHMALERAPPPRLPSASSSRHSDRHTRRLRRQEQALNEHVLQSPQPQRDFQFVGGPSPQSYPAIPMYDSYLHSGTSPASFYATAQNAPPAAPPPPPLGYYSPPHAPPVPYSSGHENNLAMMAHQPMAAPSSVVQPPPFPYPSPHAPQYQPYPPGPDLSKTTVMGYEMLADKLGEGAKDGRHDSRKGSLVPMYRKFEQLNHRVLLHLQDEISELEEELRYLDECIAQCAPRDETGHVYPASRRGDARYGNELHHRRTELLGRIYLKLGQYNSALTSFSNMLKNQEPASAEDIQAYRTWLEGRRLIDYAESRFLERKTDLLAVSRKSAGTVGGVSTQQSAAIWLPLILVLPLMVFAIVPGLLGRLFMLLLIGAGVVKLLTTTQELMELMTIREWTGCFSIYFGVMAVLAALVR